jgi:hypothetical protein
MLSEPVTGHDAGAEEYLQTRMLRHVLTFLPVTNKWVHPPCFTG